MKTIFTLLLAATTTILAKAQNDNSPYLTKTFNASVVQNVTVRTSGGSISITGSTGEARVEVYVKGNNNKNLSKADIEERLKNDYILDISASGGKLNAIAGQKNKMFN